MTLSIKLGEDLFTLEGLEPPIDAVVLELVKIFVSSHTESQPALDGLAIKLNHQSTKLADAVQRNQPGG